MAEPREFALLRFVIGYQTAHGGVSPTVRECARGIGLRAPSGVMGLFARLQRDGYIRRLPRGHCAIEVLRPIPIPSIDGTPLRAVPFDASRASFFQPES